MKSLAIAILILAGICWYIDHSGASSSTRNKPRFNKRPIRMTRPSRARWCLVLKNDPHLEMPRWQREAGRSGRDSAG